MEYNTRRKHVKRRPRPYKPVGGEGPARGREVFGDEVLSQEEYSARNFPILSKGKAMLM